MGKHNGLNGLVSDETPWVEVVHCFNHQLELVIKDAFIESTFYSNINEMLSKLYWLYQKSPKRLTELKELSKAFEKLIRKPAKADVQDGSILSFEQWSLHYSFRAACPYPFTITKT